MAQTTAKQDNITQITHESEMQRQHIRIHLPAGLKLNGNDGKIKDLSAGGFSIKCSKKIPQKIYGIEINFPFDSFNFNLNLKAEPVYFNNKNNIVGFRFVSMNPRQVSMLTNVIKTYLAGEIVSEGELLNVAARNNFIRPDFKKTSNDNYSNSKLARIFPVTAILIAGLIGLYFISSNIYETTSLVRSYRSVVEGNVFTIRAPVNGSVFSLLAEGTREVSQGQPIVAIRNRFNGTDDMSDKEIVLRSPCDCLVVSPLPSNGEFRPAGEAIITLLPKDSPIWITASLTPDQIQNLAILDDARIKIVGEGKFIEGNVVAFLPPDTAMESATIKISTDTPIPPEMVGRMAYVEIIL